MTTPERCDCELRTRQWNGFGRCLFCGRQYVDTRPQPYGTEPQDGAGKRKGRP